ncbi:alpha/beta hydrolase [Pendulispora brunnea]|uniref:Alpha/beta hydrolase n=1 Tax=Pendulispora brunnea TaxID=2905690 RepID=A0ABZ2KE24_9BACT
MKCVKYGLAAGAMAVGLVMGCSDDDSAPAKPPAATTDAGDMSKPDAGAPGTRAWYQFGFKDEVLDQIVLFYLGHVWDQSADAGEVLETVGRVNESDPASWAREWRKTAERLGTLAQESERTGHPLSAAQAYLRSATYYRAALHHHMEPLAAEVRELAQREVDSFGKYLALSKSPCEAVRIPYENTTLPGYFCKSPSATTKAPVLLFQEGRDGWAEDGMFVVGEAMKRGYHVLMFDGPGMGQVLRLQNLPFRADWENVVTPVVNYAVGRAEVDPARIGLMSFSMGGYMGPRAATKEHRLKALVANPGVIDWSAIMEGYLQQVDPNLLTLVDTDEAAFNAKIDALMQNDAFMRWGLNDFMWHHGVNTPATLIKELRKYKLGDAVKDIQANTLVVDADAETYGQSQALFDALQSKKQYLKFTEAETAQFHCQPGASAIATHRLLEWLEGAL